MSGRGARARKTPARYSQDDQQPRKRRRQADKQPSTSTTRGTGGSANQDSGTEEQSSSALLAQLVSSVSSLQKEMQELKRDRLKQPQSSKTKNREEPAEAEDTDEDSEDDILLEDITQEAVSSITGQRVTRQLLKTRSGEFDVESIHSLVLRGLGIDDPGCIGECSSLERLDLSQNDITRLYSLAGLTNLVSLNLSCNRISSLEGLQALDNLTTLKLSGNLIGSLDTLKSIAGLPKLTDLRLQDKTRGLSNPVCLNTSYRPDIRKMFPNLTVIDGERVSGKGSEVFKMFEELDKAIEESKETTASTLADIKPQPYVEPDFWIHKEVQQFEQTDLSNMEQQFIDLLEDCKRLSKDADTKLANLS